MDIQLQDEKNLIAFGQKRGAGKGKGMKNGGRRNNSSNTEPEIK